MTGHDRGVPLTFLFILFPFAIPSAPVVPVNPYHS